MDLTKLQENFLKVLENQGFNVSAACSAAGVGRRTYYNWMQREEFAQEVDDLREGSIDFTESKLMLNIKAGKEKSIFFFLEHKGKSRGYGKDGQEIVHRTSPTLVELIKEHQEEETRHKKKTEKLITVLKTYIDEGLNLEQAREKLLKDENIVLDKVIKIIGEKELTLSELVRYIKQIPILEKLKNMISKL